MRRGAPRDGWHRYAGREVYLCDGRVTRSRNPVTGCEQTLYRREIDGRTHLSSVSVATYYNLVLRNRLIFEDA